MAQKILNTKIREAYDTEANWVKYNPVLLAGQLAFSSDKYGKYKVGNGNSTWSQLQYATLSWGDILGKPSSFTPSTHIHTISQITDIGSASVKYATTSGTANAVPWSGITGKPSSFTPSTHTHTASQITGLPTKLPNPQLLTFTGAANTKYDGSGAITVHIPTASATPSSLAIQLNSGTTEGTNKFTFNGSAAKTVNITPSVIGAATVSHTHSQYAPTSHKHTISQITDISQANVKHAISSEMSTYLKVPDTRNENPAPNNAGFKKQAVAFDFRLSSKINSPTNNTYVGLMSFAPWSNTSGGNGYQMAFGYLNATTPKLMIRTADLEATTWGAWHKIYTSGDKPTPAEIGAATSGHTHNYAGSSSAGGAANSANVLNANAGSSTQPVYFTGGKPVACTYTLGKSVPSNAVFTDTNTWRPIQDNLTSTSTTDSLSANQGRILKGLIDGKAPSSHTHTIANITNLQSILDGKAATSHTHSIYATANHYHNMINDFNSGSSIGISSSVQVTPTTVNDYDIVVANTGKYGNKLVTMTKVSFVEHVKDHIISVFPLKAITNSQIDSLASL